jgi:hypothetical protein
MPVCGVAIRNEAIAPLRGALPPQADSGGDHSTGAEWQGHAKQGCPEHRPAVGLGEVTTIEVLRHEHMQDAGNKES